MAHSTLAAFSISLVALLAVACAPAAPPSPTAAPARPAATAVPAATAKPTEAPAAKPAEKPAEKAAPTAAAKPAEKPAAAASPAAKPVAAPSAAPATKPAFDEKAVADFYRGKTVRFVVGYAAGGPFDIHARIVARYMPQYLPGSPTMIVDNKPGGSGFLATNLVFNTEPKDGTVINLVGAGLPLQQVLGKDGIQFDVTKMNWLGSGTKTVSACSARVDTGVKSLQDVTGPNGKEVAIAAIGPGTTTFDTPAVLNATLGTRFKLVPGYSGGATMVVAVDAREADGICGNLDNFTGPARHLIDPQNPQLKMLVVMGAEPVNLPWLQGVPAAETLAKTEEARLMLQAVNSQSQTYHPYMVAPEVPRERVEALRKALLDTFANPQFRADAEKAGFVVSVVPGEELGQSYRKLLSLPPAIVARLKETLK